MALSSDVTVRDIDLSYENFRYRTPIKFGGTSLDQVTILNVRMSVESRSRGVASGFASMPLGNAWAFPSCQLSYEHTLGAMKAIAEAVRHIYLKSGISGHPINITHQLESSILASSSAVHKNQHFAEPIPPLATLVSASPFDAALHDAYAKSICLNCYHTYGPDLFPHDLEHYLGAAFQGETLERYLWPHARPTMAVYHLVGALDPITPADLLQPVADGLPEHLADWIIRDGLTHLKIKLNGDDLDWDVDRVETIDMVTAQTQSHLRKGEWFYSLDFNERCRDVGYLVEFLRRLQLRTPRGYERVQYIEQPTHRELNARPANRMHEAAKMRPIVIDESLLDLESLELARDMGYTGVAFKACKGQTQTLLLAAAAQKYGLFRCVQDLTCPGASLIQSAGLAAHIPGVAAIEANSRQYCPAANAGWDDNFPGVFTIRGGVMNTAILDGPGLGAVPPEYL